MSTIRATALMHQYTPGSHPSEPLSRRQRAVAVVVPLLLAAAIVVPA